MIFCIHIGYFLDLQYFVFILYKWVLQEDKWRDYFWSWGDHRICYKSPTRIRNKVFTKIKMILGTIQRTLKYKYRCKYCSREISSTYSTYFTPSLPPLSGNGSHIRNETKSAKCQKYPTRTLTLSSIKICVYNIFWFFKVSASLYIPVCFAPVLAVLVVLYIYCYLSLYYTCFSFL